MPGITDQTLEQAFQNLSEEFDTHEVIQKVMQIAPREYADDLGAQDVDDPFMTLHSRIGKRLLGFGAIEPTVKVVSMNVRGQENENQKWRKV